MFCRSLFVPLFYFLLASVGTVQKYHTVGTVKKYHTVGTVQKSRKAKNTTLSEQFQNRMKNRKTIYSTTQFPGLKQAFK
jgi:hypothetical protein